MAWVKFSDNFPNHPKVNGLSNEAFRLHVTAMCHANHFLTDGVITVGTADREAATIIRALHVTMAARREQSGDPPVDPITDLPACNDVIEELIEAGIWDRTKTGYAIHDYHKYQLRSDEVEARRLLQQQGQHIGGLKRVAGAQRDEKGRLLPAIPASPPASSQPRTRTRREESSPTGDGEASSGETAPRRRVAFRAPSVEQVREYAVSKGWAEAEFDAVHFVQFYGSKGWVVGRAPMKDWHLAAQRAHREGWTVRKGNGTAAPAVDPVVAAKEREAANAKALAEAREKMRRQGLHPDG